MNILNLKHSIGKSLIYGTIILFVFYLLYSCRLNVTEHSELLNGIGKSLRIVSQNAISENLAILFSGSEVQSSDAWYDVDEENNAYVFSAYYDEERSPTVVTILGMYIGNATYFCQLGYTSADKILSTKEVDATVHRYRTNRGKYKTCKFNCRLPNNDIPTSVSLVSRRGHTPRHKLPVTEIIQAPYERNLTICVKALKLQYGRAHELVEFMEVHRVLGVERFIIYNHSSTANVGKVLDYYSKQGILDVVQWPVPDVDVMDEGSVLTLNDCLRRVRQKSRFLAILDLDEFIIPHSSKSWTDMIKELPDEGAYLFKTVMFRKEWDNTEKTFSGKDIAEKYMLMTLLKTEREERDLEPPVRSKYLVRTNAVDDLDTHDVENMTLGFRQYIVPTKIAYLHHYRKFTECDFKEPKRNDYTMIEQYKDDILNNVLKAWSELHNVELVM